MTTYDIPTDAEMCLFISEVAGVGPIEPDGLLVDHGVDSMTLVTVVLRIEQEFNAVIPDALLTAEAFRTPRSIAKTIRGVLSSP